MKIKHEHIESVLFALAAEKAAGMGSQCNY